MYAREGYTKSCRSGRNLKYEFKLRKEQFFPRYLISKLLQEQHQKLAVTVVNPFPHTTILQQTTLNIVYQKIENPCN